MNDRSKRQYAPQRYHSASLVYWHIAQPCAGYCISKQFQYGHAAVLSRLAQIIERIDISPTSNSMRVLIRLTAAVSRLRGWILI